MQASRLSQTSLAVALSGSAIGEKRGDAICHAAGGPPGTEMGSAVILSDGREGVNYLAGRDGTAGVDNVGGDHPIVSRTQDFGHAIDRELELALEDIGDLVVGMRMLRQIDARVEVPMGYGHSVRVDETDAGAWNEFSLFDVI